MVKSNKQNNNLGAVGGNTGGLPVVHDVNTGKAELKIPPADKTDAEPLGLAKASPNFRYVTPKTLASKAEEEEELRKNTLKDNSTGTDESATDEN